MPNVFKNARAVLGATLADVYTVPAGTTTVVIGVHVANVDTASRDLTMTWIDASASNAVTYLADLITIPAKAAYEPVGKLVLMAGDKIQGMSSVASGLEVTVSVLEQS